MINVDDVEIPNRQFQALILESLLNPKADHVSMTLNIRLSMRLKDFVNMYYKAVLIMIRGALKVTLVDDDKNIIDAQINRPADGVYGVQ